jgi:hypothetical protein
MSKGVIYIAYTNIKFINEAIFSATSLKKHNPNLSVTIFTDYKLTNNCFDIVNTLPKDSFKFRCKQNFLIDSPYENTLYIDTDTFINDNIEDMFDLLEKFDVCMVHDYARKRIINEKNPNIPSGYYFNRNSDYMKIPYSFPEYNGGIMLYKKNDKVINFIKYWKNKYEEMKHLTPYDQPSLRISLWNCDIKIHSLPIEYNCRSKKIKEKNINYRNKGIFQDNHLTPRIFHWHDISKLKDINEINSMAQYF